VAIGALVPAAIMSISASNLFTRNLYGAFARKPLNPSGESQMAKAVSLVVKFGALIFVLRLPVAYAIDMQLLGGIWIAQLFPAVVIGIFSRWFHPWALLAGWAAGMGAGTAMVISLGMKSSVYPLHLFGQTYAMYAAVPALLLNLLVALVLTLAFRMARVGVSTDVTDASAYVG
jgi:SSS family solute:Na+ symporter